MKRVVFHTLLTCPFQYVYPQRANRQKHILDIDFHFADQPGAGGGRGGGGGRGRGRGRGGRGGGRGEGEVSQDFRPMPTST